MLQLDNREYYYDLAFGAAGDLRKTEAIIEAKKLGLNSNIITMLENTIYGRYKNIVKFWYYFHLFI